MKKSDSGILQSSSVFILMGVSLIAMEQKNIGITFICIGIVFFLIGVSGYAIGQKKR